MAPSSLTSRRNERATWRSLIRCKVLIFCRFVSLLFRRFMLFHLLTGDVAFRLHRAPSILTMKRNERAAWRSLIRRKRESEVSYSPQVLLFFFFFSFVVLSICAFAVLSFCQFCFVVFSNRSLY